MNLKTKFLFFILNFTLFVFTFSLNSYAKEITIIYTGQTHAMLYPCNCPKEPDGGISRRASLIKQIRSKNSNTLLLDCGSFFGGGSMDDYSQNSQLDMERTKINLKAMELMRYDAVALSEDEFNFGKDFLASSINNFSVPVLSSNVKGLNKVAPYKIIEVASTKFGITALTAPTAKVKSVSVELDDLRKSIEDAVSQLKSKGVDIVVVLSNINETDTLGLIEDIKDIDILIDFAQDKVFGSAKKDNLLVTRASWEARKLGKLTLEIKQNKIADYKAEDLRLSDKIKDSSETLALLPQCFSDLNCKNGAVLGSCVNPGTNKAYCNFAKTAKVPLVIITPKDCVTCNTENVSDFLKKQFPGLTISYQYYPDSKASKIIKDLGIKALPAYLLKKEVETENNFPTFKSSLEVRGDYYMLKPEFSGVSYFIGRNKIKDKLDIFVSLYDKNTRELLDNIKEYKPQVHLLVVEDSDGFDAANGGLEVEDCLRASCVQKYFPEAYWEYISCRAKRVNSSWWEDCLGKFNSEIIKNCARGKEGAALLKENIALNKELQVMFGPTYLLDNQKIFSSNGALTKQELKKILKR